MTQSHDTGPPVEDDPLSLCENRNWDRLELLLMDPFAAQEWAETLQEHRSPPQELGRLIPLIAAEGLVPQIGAKKIDTQLVGALMANPEAFRDLHEAIIDSDSPYWANRYAKIDQPSAATTVPRGRLERIGLAGAWHGAALQWRRVAIFLGVCFLLCGATFATSYAMFVARIRHLEQQVVESNVRGATRLELLSVSKDRRLVVRGNADPNFVETVVVSVKEGDAFLFREDLVPRKDGTIDWQSKPLLVSDKPLLAAVDFKPRPEFDPARENAPFKHEGYFGPARTHHEQRFSIQPSGVMLLDSAECVTVVPPTGQPLQLKDLQNYDLDVESTIDGKVAIFLRAEGDRTWYMQPPREIKAGERRRLTCAFGRGGRTEPVVTFEAVAQLYKAGTEIPTGPRFDSLPKADVDSMQCEIKVSFSK